MFHNILFQKLRFYSASQCAHIPTSFKGYVQVSKAAQKFISRLLDRNETTRLGSGPTGLEDIISHEFFEDIDFQKVYKCEIVPEYIPEVDNAFDVSNVDT